MSIDSELARWTVLAFVNIPVYLGLGVLFFGDWGEFWSCVRFWFTPDWASMLSGEYFEDRWSEAKLFLFVALCLLALYGEYRFFFGTPFTANQVAAQPNPPLNSDPACIVFRSFSSFVFLGSVHRLGAGGAG